MHIYPHLIPPGHEDHQHICRNVDHREGGGKDGCVINPQNQKAAVEILREQHSLATHRIQRSKECSPWSSGMFISLRKEE